MKNIYILLFFSILTVNTYAQEQSKFLVGGSIGIDVSDNSEASNLLISATERSFALTTSPFIGYSISKIFLVGTGLEINSVNVKYGGINFISETKQLSLLLSPFVRLYINSPVFFQGQFYIGQTNENLVYNPYATGGGQNEILSKYFTLGYGIGLGYDIDLGEKVKLEPLIKYVSYKFTDKETDEIDKTSSYIFNLGLIYRF